MAAPAPVVAKDPPVLEASDRVLDSRASPTMDSPSLVAQNATMAEARRAQLLDAAVAAVGEDASVRAAESLDR